MKRLILYPLILLSAGFLQPLYGLPASQDAFTWHVFTEGNLTLYCQKEDLHLSGRLLATATGELKKLREVIPTPADFSTALIIAPSEQVYRRITGGTMPDWSSGAANPGAGMIYLKSPRIANPSVSINRILCHELSHVLLGMITRHKPVERWFDEGLAEYMSGRLALSGIVQLARYAGSGDLHSFEALNGMLGFGREEASLAYLEARSAIEYLVRSYGLESLTTLIKHLSEMNMDKAMRRTTGVDLNTFEAGWKNDLRRRYRWAFLMDGSRLIMLLFIALFFMALIATLRRIRIKKDEWEEEFGE